MKKTLLFLLLCMMLPIVSAGSNEGVPYIIGFGNTGLRLYLPFENNVTDMSGNGVSCSWQGSAVYRSLLPTLGSGIGLNNLDSQYVICTDAASLTFQNAITIIVWANQTEKTRGVAINQNSTSGYLLEWFDDASTKTGEISSWIGGNQSISSNNTMPRNTVGMFAVTWNSTINSGKLTNYFNSTEVSGYDKTEYRTATFTDWSSPLYIGRHATRTGRTWNGTLDEIAIYGYSLSSSNISKIYTDATKGIQILSALSTVTNLQVNQTTHNTMLVSWTNPIESTFNHTKAYYNCTSTTLYSAGSITPPESSLLITGLQNNTFCTIYIYSCGHNNECTPQAATQTNLTQQVNLGVFDNPATINWVPELLRSKWQSDQGFSYGGEAFQWVFNLHCNEFAPQTCYAITDTTKVWRTDDSGASWVMVARNLSPKGGNSIVSDPLNPNIVLISASKMYPTLTSGSNEGIWRSTDAGITLARVYPNVPYEREGVGQMFYFDRSTYDGTCSRTVYAGTTDGVLKSTDCGATWAMVSLNLTSTFGEGVRDIEGSPSNISTLLVLTNKSLYRLTRSNNNMTKIGTGLPTQLYDMVIARDDYNKVWVGGNNGVYYSSDNGNTFIGVNTGLDTTKAYKHLGISNTTLYAAPASKSPNFPYYSTDGGASWSQPTTINSSQNVVDLDYFMTSAIAIKEDNHDQLIVFYDGAIVKSIDAGATYNWASQGMTGARVSDMSFINETVRYICLTDYGLIRTINNGSTWEEVDFTTSSDKSCGSVSVSGNTIIATQGSWTSQIIRRSTDGGASWSTVSSPNGESWYSVIDGSDVYVGMKLSGSDWRTYYSADSGATWATRTGWTITDYNGSSLLGVRDYGTYVGVAISHDKGVTWHSKGNNITTTSNIYTAKYDPFNSTHVMVAVGYDGVYEYTNGAWVLRDNAEGLTQGSGNYIRVTFHPLYEGVAFANKQNYNSDHASVLGITKNGGKTWTNSLNNLGNYQDSYNVFIDPYNDISYLISPGIWKISTDSEPFSLGLLSGYTVLPDVPIGATDYYLIHNETFNNQASLTTNSSSTWAYINTSCKSGYCLSRTDSNAVYAYAYIANTTFNNTIFNSFDTIIKGWCKNPEITQSGAGYVHSLVNSGNYYLHGLRADGTTNKYKIDNTQIKNGVGNSYYLNELTNTSIVYNDWYWCVLDINRQTNLSSFSIYIDSSENNLISGSSITLSADNINNATAGVLGFGSYRKAMFDDVEYWAKTGSAGDIAISITKDYAVAENTTSVINFTISWINRYVQNISPALSFNGVTYLPTTTNSYGLGGYNGSINYSFVVRTPFISVNSTSVPLTLYYNLTNSTGGQAYYTYTDSLLVTLMRSLNITFKNYITDKVITDSVIYISLISDSAAKNYTVYNGSLYLTDLPRDALTIRYSGDSYSPHSYFTTVENDLGLILYTAPVSNTSLILFSIINERSASIQDATLKVLSYFIEDNSWKVVNMEKTDQNGQTGVYLVPYTWPYIFRVEKDNKVLFESSQNKIFQSDVSIVARTQIDVFAGYVAVNEYLSDFFHFNNRTKVVSYSWNDASGLVNYGCLEVYKSSPIGTNTIYSECGYSSAGSIYFDISSYIDNRSEIYASAWVHTDTTYSIKPRYTNIGLATILDYKIFGKQSLFFSFLFIGTMFFIGLWLGEMVAIIFSGIAMYILQMVGFINLTIPFIIGIIVIIGVVTYFNEAKK